MTTETSSLTASQYDVPTEEDMNIFAHGETENKNPFYDPFALFIFLHGKKGLVW